MIDDQTTVAWVAREVLPHEAGVRAWLRKAGVQAAEIDDIVQEAYCKLSQLDGVAHIRNPRAYFHITVRSLLLQRLRREKTVPMQAFAEGFEVADSRPSVEETVGARLALSRVVKAIRALPGNYRVVVELRRIEGLSQKETARRLGISEKIVENNLSRGLDALLSAMEREEAAHRTRDEDDVEGARQVAGH